MRSNPWKSNIKMLIDLTAEGFIFSIASLVNLNAALGSATKQRISGYGVRSECEGGMKNIILIVILVGIFLCCEKKRKFPYPKSTRTTPTANIEMIK